VTTFARLVGRREAWSKGTERPAGAGRRGAALSTQGEDPFGRAARAVAARSTRRAAPRRVRSDGRWGARRQGERIPFCKPISLQKTKEEGGKVTEVEVEALFEGWALNINKGGMRIITEQPLKEGDVISVELTSSGVPYSGQARVCWVRQQADGVIAGLRFEDRS
jgi:hypothetical protein